MTFNPDQPDSPPDDLPLLEPEAPGGDLSAPFPEEGQNPEPSFLDSEPLDGSSNLDSPDGTSGQPGAWSESPGPSSTGGGDDAPGNLSLVSPDPLAPIREAAAQSTELPPQVEAAFPFSLRIHGHLSEDERARLIDLVNREKLGIREVDLEPQFEAGRILIPRISEFAGILLVQTLRSTQARLELLPSEHDGQDDLNLAPPEPKSTAYAADGLGNARLSPVTSLPSLPEQPTVSVIEVLTASGVLSTREVEAEHAPEYQELLEALQDQIRHQALLKGAQGVVNFQVALVRLNLPTRYRVTVSGSAVRWDS